jgi:YidC/Oxa1 family membrane protein insertase
MSRALGLLKGEGGLAGKIEKFKPGQASGSYRWVGVDNRYFLAAVLTEKEPPSAVEARFPPQVVLTFAGTSLAPGASRTWELPYYIGPKGNTWLSRYQAGLDRSIDFGFFAQLGRFVLKVLDRLHGYTGNWGWSIILLTLLLQLVLFPLTYKSLKAAAAMKRLQPEIARLQQKYSKEPGRLNTEMMELYKKHGANPLGGCLPMLLQMPIFVALFNALRNAWELHGAAWIFWIKDLSAKDPYYVLPLIMGGLMYAQSRLNPPSADPAQAGMMKMMPIIFTFMFLKFPAGLVLYWLTNSLGSTVQPIALKDYFNSGPQASRA